MAKGIKYIVRVQRYESHYYQDVSINGDRRFNQWVNRPKVLSTTHKVYKTLRGAKKYIEKLYSSGEDVNVELYEQIPTKIEQQELYLKQPF